MNSRELEFCTFVEQEYLLHSAIPSYDRVDEYMTCTRAWYQRCLDSEEVQNHLTQRGVPIKRILSGQKAGALTAQQLICANTLLDFNDKRSDRKKLQDLEIPTATYAAWKKDPGFQDYMRQRAENLFGDNLDEVHRALLDNARSGDISSVKLIYELTGRYNPRADGQIDTRAVITKVLESIMRHVKDPETIKAIAADFQLIATSSHIGGPVIDTVATRSISA